MNTKKKSKITQWLNNLICEPVKVPEDNVKMAVALNEKECYARGLPNTIVKLHWDIKNDSQ
jgi:hypothetical protein